MVVSARWLGFGIGIFWFFFLPQKIWAAFSFSIDNISSQTIDTLEQEVTVNLKINDLPSESYFRAAFKKGDDSGSYFGYVKNNQGSWAKIESLNSDCSNYYKVTDLNLEQLSLTVKIGADTQISPGEYLLRGHRFTAASCSNKASENAATVTVNVSNSPSPSPQNQVSPSAGVDSKVEYRINKAKNAAGETLSRVQIYVDGQYTHHVDNETLYFCDGCFCDDDKEVACGFGEHTIRLEKSGYEPWSETKNISQGDSFEVNPTLKAVVKDEDEDSSGPSPEPTTEAQVLGSTTQKPSSTNLQSTKANNDRNFDASFSGEILNASDSSEGEKEEEKQEEINEEKNKDWLIPLGLSGGGLVLISTAALPFVKPKILKLLKRQS